MLAAMMANPANREAIVTVRSGGQGLIVHHHRGPAYGLYVLDRLLEQPSTVHGTLAAVPRTQGPDPRVEFSRQLLLCPAAPVLWAFSSSTLP